MNLLCIQDASLSLLIFNVYGKGDFIILGILLISRCFCTKIVLIVLNNDRNIASTHEQFEYREIKLTDQHDMNLKLHLQWPWKFT